MEKNEYSVIVIGGGLSGLATANFLLDQLDKEQADVLVLEGGSRPGGAIQSFSEGGFLAEWGPHGFLDNCKESRELIRIAELKQEVVKAPLSRFVRYICLDGRLQCIPQKPGKILAAPLISSSAKLRVLAELWKKPLAGEPTVAQWVEHRLGAALLPFADAVFTGTYAGDIERLVIDGVMPGIRELERAHGSFIRGLLAKRKEKKKSGTAGKKGMPSMTSFKTGMQRLPVALAACLERQQAIRYDAPVKTVQKTEKGWTLSVLGKKLSCRQLVIATQINHGLELLATESSITAPPQQKVPTAKICSVLLGFDSSARVPFGFGYLAPEREHRFALGSLFSSHMFTERAPKGQILLEALVGGRRHPEKLELSDGELQQRTLTDLQQLMDLPGEPLFQKVLRPPGGIPQLEAGYPALLDWRKKLHTSQPDLHVLGFGWQGIGINDMCKEAGNAAKRIFQGRSNVDSTEVKPVYF